MCSVAVVQLITLRLAVVVNSWLLVCDELVHKVVVWYLGYYAVNSRECGAASWCFTRIPVIVLFYDCRIITGPLCVHNVFSDDNYRTK